MCNRLCTLNALWGLDKLKVQVLTWQYSTRHRLQYMYLAIHICWAKLFLELLQAEWYADYLGHSSDYFLEYSSVTFCSCTPPSAKALLSRISYLVCKTVSKLHWWGLIFLDVIAIWWSNRPFAICRSYLGTLPTSSVYVKEKRRKSRDAHLWDLKLHKFIRIIKSYPAVLGIVTCPKQPRLTLTPFEVQNINQSWIWNYLPPVMT